MAFLLSLAPDLTHVNGYGGDLMSTIIHGSENAHKGVARDHVECACLALEAGAELRPSDIAATGDLDLAGFLSDWAEAHPDRVTGGEDV